MSTALSRRAAAPLAVAGAAADRAAAAAAFDAYRRRRAPNTLARQDHDLALFTRFLWSVGTAAEELGTRPEAWAGVSWGLVAAFVEWQLQEGYAIDSVNVRLSTVKSYAKLAMQAGVLNVPTYAQIKAVGGYRAREGRNVDAQRETTRRGAKKAAPVSISLAQATLLKDQPEPADGLLMCVLLDHGLRIGEAAGLHVEHFDLADGSLVFYREKVDKTQTHQLTADTLRAALKALKGRGPGKVWPCSVRTLQNKVRALGEAVGLERLSPHDCRHAWATFATRAGTATRDLQEAGGWSSPAMPLRYAEATAVANQGVKLR